MACWTTSAVGHGDGETDTKVYFHLRDDLVE